MPRRLLRGAAVLFSVICLAFGLGAIALAVVGAEDRGLMLLGGLVVLAGAGFFAWRFVRIGRAG